MGKKEADFDGIKYYFDENRGARGRKGVTVYLVPCSKCGREIESLTYGHNHQYICSHCKVEKRKTSQLMEQELRILLTTPGERRYQKAIDAIEKQVKDAKSYQKAIRIARAGQELYGSVPEAMVAIELIRLGYKIVPQKKVASYRVDFYLPDVKTVIEVDGSLYHRKEYAGDREAILSLALGLDTRILHIPAEKIAKDIRKLKDCIDKLP